MNRTSTAAEVLAKRGDVIFHLGKSAQRKLLVSSVLLSHVSPVFAAMFDGRFAEGAALSPASPRVVALPDDDADAMTIVCKIIHVQTADMATTTTPTKLANIAMICHKYDCIDVVRAWSLLWIADIMQKPNSADFEKTLVATYLLDMATEFRDVSKSLVRDRAELPTITAMSNGHDFLPNQLLERIIKEQHEAQMRALEALGPIVPARSLCDNARKNVALFFAGLREARLWPLNTVSIADLKTRLAGMPSTRSSTNSCSLPYCACKRDTLDASYVAQNVQKIYDSVRGVCLDCAKRKRLGVDGSSCRANCYANNLTYM